ncbi:MAG TPA: hypothetical protein VET89_10730 [Stellaceae bacterium]|nr:hypothetical protein [Stellaceae bacterium]
MRTLTPTLAAVAFVVLCSEAGAMRTDNADGLYRHVEVTLPGLPGTDIFDQRSVIAPPAGIDPGLTLAPPDNRARLRIIEPPGTLDDGLQPK